jgi:hypothetical protein
MANTYTLIASSTVGSGGAASIDFTSIPSTYTDLVLKISTRNAGTNIQNLLMKLNTATTNFTYRYVEGNGASASSGSGTTGAIGGVDGSNATANTFNSLDIYFPNYAGSTNKSFSVDAVTENNGTTAYADLNAFLWSNTAAINAISIYAASSNLVQYSTAYLYGVKNA